MTHLELWMLVATLGTFLVLRILPELGGFYDERGVTWRKGAVLALVLFLYYLVRLLLERLHIRLR